MSTAPVPETQAQECARRFATTRDSRARELANLADYRERETEKALADFDRLLQKARPWALSDGDAEQRYADRAWHELVVVDASARVRDRLHELGVTQ